MEKNGDGEALIGEGSLNTGGKVYNNSKMSEKAVSHHTITNVPRTTYSVCKLVYR